VEDLRDEFTDDEEVRLFAVTVITGLAEAMSLHSKPLGDEQYYRAVRKIKGRIERAMKAEARHPGVRGLQLNADWDVVKSLFQAEGG
jgi:hypothetical protein